MFDFWLCSSERCNFKVSKGLIKELRRIRLCSMIAILRDNLVVCQCAIMSIKDDYLLTVSRNVWVNPVFIYCCVWEVNVGNLPEIETGLSAHLDFQHYGEGISDNPSISNQSHAFVYCQLGDSLYVSSFHYYLSYRGKHWGHCDSHGNVWSPDPVHRSLPSLEALAFKPTKEIKPQLGILLHRYCLQWTCPLYWFYLLLLSLPLSSFLITSQVLHSRLLV